MLLYFSIFAYTFLCADEGMFLVNQLNDDFIGQLQKLGLQITAQQIFSTSKPSLTQAIINLGGGTGSFVSPNGLILTNHHVAFGAVQRQSTPEKNYIRDGFIARSLAEEIPAPGYRARIMIEFKNISDRFIPLLKKKSNPLKVFQQIDLLKKEIIREAEKEKGIEATVADFFGGKEFYLIKYLTIKDIRIVYVPAQSIGEYGGEIDNWMWPRHTGDFSFLRAYVGKDGKPADYSPENVPFRPVSYLQLASKPLEEGDFTFIMGFPGSTSRFKCAADIAAIVQFGYPERIKILQGWIDVLEKASALDEATKIKNAGILKGLYNSIKNNQGMLEGLIKFKVAELKQNEEIRLQKWLQEDKKHQQRYARVLKDLEQIAAESLELSKRSQLLGWMSRGVRALGWAITLNKLSIENEKPDLKRESGYQLRDIPYIQQNFRIAQNSFDLTTDKLVWKYFLTEFSKVAPDKHFLIQEINLQAGEDLMQKIDNFIEKMYAATNITNLDYRLQLMQKRRSEFLKENDSFLKIAAKLQDELDAIQQTSRILLVRRLQLEPLYIEALSEMKKDIPVYSDANSTLRFNYGKVKGYEPQDAVYYKPFTTLKGVVDKNRQKFPFNLDPRIIAAYQNKDYGKYFCSQLNDVPVNFLTTNDSTGGNSGSPVLNGRGELVGLLFDGNYEAMCSDYLYLPELTRSIHVDLRYILFITEKIDRATNILQELNISR